MRHLEFVPPKELQDAIKCFWYNSRELGELPSSFEVLPDGYAEIIFHFGSPCSIACDGLLQPLPSPFLMGLLNQPMLFHAQGRFEILDLLGLPASKAAVHAFKHPIAQLQSILDQCIREDKLDESLTQIAQYFLSVQSRVPPSSMLFKAGAAMREAHGALPVSQVALAAHATVRTLERKFKQSSGHTVKDVSGLMRFEQVRNQLWLHPGANLAALAYDLGYTDQAHLSRAFKRYSGATPAAFARKAKQERQVIPGAFVAFIQD